jgi:hypothetical protein
LIKLYCTYTRQYGWGADSKVFRTLEDAEAEAKRQQWDWNTMELRVDGDEPPDEVCVSVHASPYDEEFLSFRLLRCKTGRCEEGQVIRKVLPLIDREENNSNE